MNSKPFIVLVALVLMPAITAPLGAYELGTHARVTRTAFERSVLATDAELLKSLGIQTERSPFGEVYLDATDSRVAERRQSDFETIFMPNAEEKLTAGLALQKLERLKEITNR